MISAHCRDSKPSAWKAICATPIRFDRALQGVNRVFHVAADYRLWSRNPTEIYESNVTGTRNLLEAAKRARVEQFIYTGTVATIAVDRPVAADGSHRFRAR